MTRLKKLWKRVSGFIVRLLGDTRSPEVRDAPFGCMEMTFSGNRHRREAEALRQASKAKSLQNLNDKEKQ